MYYCKIAPDGANKNTTRANFSLKVDYFFSQKIRKTEKFSRLEGGPLCIYVRNMSANTFFDVGQAMELKNQKLHRAALATLMALYTCHGEPLPQLMILEFSCASLYLGFVDMAVVLYVVPVSLATITK